MASENYQATVRAVTVKMRGARLLFALALAVLQPSPLSGGYPWLLGALVAFGGLAGRPMSNLLAAPDPDAASPAVPGAWRRLDTLLVVAPAWLLVAAVARF